MRKSGDCERWVAEAVSQLGRLDILVNCAAGNFLVGAFLYGPAQFPCLPLLSILVHKSPSCCVLPKED